MANGPVVIGTRRFGSRAAAQRDVQACINGARLGEPLASAQYELARALLEMHPQRDDKLARGCAAIVVVIAEGFTTRCLAVVGDEGTAEEFSWRVALGIVPCTPSLAAACRTAVAETVARFRTESFARGPVRCATSGAGVESETAHVDHAPPWTFAAIVDAFSAAHPDLKPIHQGTMDVFATDAEAELFRRFHDARAVLRIVHRRENLSTLRRRAGLGSQQDRESTC
jgi:hypothetical protein